MIDYRELISHIILGGERSWTKFDKLTLFFFFFFFFFEIERSLEFKFNFHIDTILNKNGRKRWIESVRENKR